MHGLMQPNSMICSLDKNDYLYTMKNIMDMTKEELNSLSEQEFNSALIEKIDGILAKLNGMIEQLEQPKNS